MENTKVKLNSIKQRLVVTMHIIQGHVRKDGIHMPVETKLDLENTVQTLNEIVGELNDIVII
ncbi:MAG: hypothetical protein V1917_04005 [Candidatus Gottesmanbacteria bacterium]